MIVEPLKVGDKIMYDADHGSLGEVTQETERGYAYVRYNYGLNIHGKPIRELSAVHMKDLIRIPDDLYKAATEVPAWSVEQKAARKKIMEYIKQPEWS